MRQRHAGGVARAVFEIEAESRPRFKLDRAVRERSDTQLRPLKVRQNTDRAACLMLHLTNNPVARGLLFMRAVRHVEAKHVGPGLKQRLYHRPVRRRGTKRGDDFDVTIAAHGNSLTLLPLL